MSLSGGPEDADELCGWFAALSEGGQVRQPLEPAPWGDEFGMFVDRFGISWLVNIAGSLCSRPERKLNGFLIEHVFY